MKITITIDQQQEQTTQQHTISDDLLRLIHNRGTWQPCDGAQEEEWRLVEEAHRLGFRVETESTSLGFTARCF